jgi:hypothetical protein
MPGAAERSGALAYPKHPLAKDWRLPRGGTGPPRFVAIAVSLPSFANQATKLTGARRSPSYASAIARAIFWEMYPSTAPMIREITPTMNGFSSEAEVIAPSLLPVNARPATAA